jgi:hypothetical protein
MRTSSLLGATVICALLAGAAISVAAFLVARYGPSGDSWSFKGNGAISVYTAFPAVIAGGWTALVLHARGRPGWLALGVAAGVAGLVMGLIGAAALPLFGIQGDAIVTPIALIALLLWVIVAPALAARRDPRAVPLRGYGSHVAAGAAWLAAAAAGVAIVGSIIPAGS